MASGVNKVILIGRLGTDPEVRYTSGGSAVANFNMATNDSWTDKTGQKQERTEWHRIVVWGKIAEICGQYLSKGRQAYVEGRLQTREWTDKENNKRYTTEIVAQTVQFLGGQGDRAGAGAGAGASAGHGQGQNQGQSHGQDFAPAGDFEGASGGFGGGGGGGFGGGAPSGGGGGGGGMSDDEVPF